MTNQSSPSDKTTKQIIITKVADWYCRAYLLAVKAANKLGSKQK